jgi:hypothetical protein
LDRHTAGLHHGEAVWIVARPEFEASARLKTLLLYLAERSDRKEAAAPSQVDIARDVMDLGQDFDPSNDAHVRIEVARLRTALAGFYSRLAVTRPRRMSIPKGAYKTELTYMSNPVHGANTPLKGTVPTMALGILCTPDSPSQRLAFELECDLINVISNSDLIADQLLAFSVVNGTSIDGLAKQAARIGADCLTVIHTSQNETGSCAYLSVLRPWDGRVLSAIKLGVRSDANGYQHGIHRIALEIAAQVLDPIGGCIPKTLTLLRPDASMSQLAHVFSFMVSQDRQALPLALEAAKSNADTSTTAKALLIDMTRASYCFATDRNIRDLSGLADKAETLCDQHPDNSWANLAMGYAGVSNDHPALCNRAVDNSESIQIYGSQSGDLELLRSLTDLTKASGLERKVPLPQAELSLFDTIRLGISAISHDDRTLESDALVQSKHADVFWVQAFQIASQVQRGELTKARETCGAMQSKNPGVHEYLNRAITTMIPNAEVKGKILSGLRQASG